MASIITIGINLSKIDKSKIRMAKNGDKYLELNITVSDETNQYGQNAAASISQTKEERDAKAAKVYLGNGKVVWNDGKIKNAENKEASTAQNPAMQNNTGKSDDDLPF